MVLSLELKQKSYLDISRLFLQNEISDLFGNLRRGGKKQSKNITQDNKNGEKNSILMFLLDVAPQKQLGHCNLPVRTGQE